MASIRKRGGSYLLVVSMGYDYQGKRIKPVQKTIKPPAGMTPKQEEKWISEQALLFEMEVKNQQQPANRNITLAKYIEVWNEKITPEKLSLSTLTREQQDIQRILPHLGHYKLTEIKPEILRKFYDVMRNEKSKKTGKPLAEKTVEGIHSCLCGILTDAMEGGYLTSNPAWRAYKPKGKKKEVFIADEELIARLVECLEQESIKYEVYFKLVILTGMRRGDINWRKRSIHIQRNVVNIPHHPVQVKQPKTQAGDRIVYISKEMCGLLKEYRRFCEQQCSHDETETLTDEDYLFRQPNGLPMSTHTFTWRFNKILSKYELPNELTVHSLRHSNASLLISQNVDVRTVAGLLGHAQPSTTLDIYSHAFDKGKKEASEKLCNVLDL